jgi:hypothetical protein
MKLNNSKKIDGKVSITKEFEETEEFKKLLESKGNNPASFQKWREKNPDVDLSIYSINK